MANSEIERLGFSKRLNLVLDKQEYPVRGRAQRILRETNLKVSDRAINKWLKGETIPDHANLAVLARYYKVSFDWLATGSGAGDGEVLPKIFIGGHNCNNSSQQIGYHNNLTITNNDKDSCAKNIPLFHANDGVIFALNHNERMFSIKLAGDIIGITPNPIIKNDILIIEPAMQPCDGDLVLLCLDYASNPRGVIAKLYEDLTGRRSVKYSPKDPEPMPLGSIICGVVVEIKRRLLDDDLLRSRLNIKWDIRRTEEKQQQ